MTKEVLSCSKCIYCKRVIGPQHDKTNTALCWLPVNTSSLLQESDNTSRELVQSGLYHFRNSDKIRSILNLRFSFLCFYFFTFVFFIRRKKGVQAVQKLYWVESFSTDLKIFLINLEALHDPTTGEAESSPSAVFPTDPQCSRVPFQVCKVSVFVGVWLNCRQTSDLTWDQLQTFHQKT